MRQVEKGELRVEWRMKCRGWSVENGEWVVWKVDAVWRVEPGNWRAGSVEYGVEGGVSSSRLSCHV